MKNLAIVGVGRWGRVLVEAVQGRSNQLRFTHAVARTPSKAEAFCSAHDIRLSADFAGLLADSSVDGIVLATPHSQHAEQIAQAAAAGMHVFCEKPVTLTRDSIERAMAAVRDAGVVFAAGHNRRFLPAMQMLRQMIADGELGRILHVEGNMSGHVGARYTADMWRVDPGESPAGGMAGSGIHVIDAMISLVGPVAAVTAQSHRLVHEIEFDDTTNMLFRFASGPTGYLVALTATAPIFRIQVFGERAHAELRGENLLRIRPLEGVCVTHEFPPVSTERLQLEAFAAAIGGGKAYPIPPQEVIAGVAAFEAVATSAASGRWVEL